MSFDKYIDLRNFHQTKIMHISSTPNPSTRFFLEPLCNPFAPSTPATIIDILSVIRDKIIYVINVNAVHIFLCLVVFTLCKGFENHPRFCFVASMSLHVSIVASLLLSHITLHGYTTIYPFAFCGYLDCLLFGLL